MGSMQLFWMGIRTGVVYRKRNVAKFGSMNNLPDFSAFSPGSEGDWETLVQKELGEKPLDSLFTTDRNGVRLGAYHTQTHHGIQSVPGWPTSLHILQSFAHDDGDAAHALALESLQGGATAVAYTGEIEVDKALKGIFFEFAPVYFHSSQPHHVLEEWKKNAAARGIAPTLLSGGIFHSQKQIDVAFIHEVIATRSRIQSIIIDVTDVHELGGNNVHALALALHRGHRALLQCFDGGISVDDASAQCWFRFAIGSSYFSEIAALRAFRALWHTVVNAYTPQYVCSTACSIAAVTSPYLQTIPDMHTNLLRGTSQAMSAIIGGANSIEVSPFDAASGAPSQEGYRWARNTIHLLLEEGRFGSIGDAAAGAYYVETLTHATGEAAWKLFQQLEAAEITEADCLSAAKEAGNKWQNAIADGEQHVLGVTRFPAKPNDGLPVGTDNRLSSPAENKWRKGGKA